MRHLLVGETNSPIHIFARSELLSGIIYLSQISSGVSPILLTITNFVAVLSQNSQDVKMKMLHSASFYFLFSILIPHSRPQQNAPLVDLKKTNSVTDELGVPKQFQTVKTIFK